MNLIDLFEVTNKEKDRLYFRMLVSTPPALGNVWLLFYSGGDMAKHDYGPSNKVESATGRPVVLNSTPISRININNSTTATITILDTEDVLTVPSSTSSYSGIEGEIRNMLRRTADNSASQYVFRWMKNTVGNFVLNDEEVELRFGGVWPIIFPNSLVVIQHLSGDQWVTVFVGLVTNVSVSYQKGGGYAKTLTINAEHPFTFIQSLDFYHNFFQALADPMVLHQKFNTKEEEALYWSQVVGQYPVELLEEIRPYMTKSFRSSDILLYLSLTQLLRLIARVANIRLFTKRLNSQDVQYSVLDQFGIPHPEQDYMSESELVEIYNTLLGKHSPLAILSSFGLFSEDVVYESPQFSPTDYDRNSLGEFDLSGVVPLRMVVDKAVAEGSEDVGVEYLMQGMLSLSVSIYYKENSRRTVQSVIRDISSSTFLSFLNLPNGSVFVMEPKHYRSDLREHPVLVVSLRETNHHAITYNTQGIVGMGQTWAGVDLIPSIFGDKLLARKELFELFMDEKLFIRSGAKEISAPTIYWPPDKVGTEGWEELMKSYVRSFLILSNSTQYTGNATIPGLVVSDVFYYVGVPVLVVEQGWLYTLSGVSMEFVAGQSEQMGLSFQYGVPLQERPLDITMPWEILKQIRVKLPPEKSPTGTTTKNTAVKPKTKPAVKEEDLQYVNLTSMGKVSEEETLETLAKKLVTPVPVDVIPSVVGHAVNETVEGTAERVKQAIQQVLEQSGVVDALQERYRPAAIYPVFSELWYPATYGDHFNIHPSLTLVGVKVYHPFIYPDNWRYVMMLDENDYFIVPVSEQACGEPDEEGIVWSVVAQNLVNVLSTLYVYTRVHYSICGASSSDFQPEWEVPNNSGETGEKGGVFWVYYNSQFLENFVAERLKNQPYPTEEGAVPAVLAKWANMVTVLPPDIASKNCIRVSWTIDERVLAE